jgi:hypothetical protein
MCHLATGDGVSFARIFKTLLDRLTSDADRKLLHRAAYAAASAKGVVDDPKSLAKLAEISPHEAASRVHAAIFFGQGQPEKALEIISPAMSDSPRESDYLYFAMISHAMGQAAEARRALNEAAQWRQQATAAKLDIDWYERVEIEHLRNEALGRIGSALSPPPVPTVASGSVPTSSSMPVAPPKSGTDPGDLDRSVAEWVVRNNGTVTLGNRRVALNSLRLLPRGPFEITSITLYYSSAVGDEDISRLAGLKKLQWLALSGEFSNDALKRLTEVLPALPELHLGLSRITEEGLLHLREMRSLRFLGLTGTTYSDKSLPPLQELPSLKSLRLNGTAVSDDGLELLSSLAKLDFLDLYENQRMTDNAPKRLEALPLLTHLSLGGSQATDRAAIAARDALPRLRKLELHDGSFSDSGLNALRNMKLTSMTLKGTNVTTRGASEFRRGRQGFQLSHNP